MAIFNTKNRLNFTKLNSSESFDDFDNKFIFFIYNNDLLAFFCYFLKNRLVLIKQIINDFWFLS